MTRFEMDDRNKIKYFCKALISVARRGPDSSKWPMRSGIAGKLFLDVFATEFIQILNEQLNNGRSYKQIADCFKTPSRLWKLSHHILKGLQMANVSPISQKKAIINLLDIIMEIKEEDLFNFSGKNLFLNHNQVLSIIKTIDMSKADIKNSLAVHNLCALLWTYTECLYFSQHAMGKEYHGLYNLEENRMSILIRDFFNLKPVSLFEFTQEFPYNALRIITDYESLKISIDVYNNILILETSPVKKLLHYFVIADGNALNIEEITNLCIYLEKLVRKIVTVIDAWPIEKKALRFGEIFWLCQKPLFDLAKKDCRLPIDVAKRIECAKFDNSALFLKSEEGRIKQLLRPIMNL